MTVSPRDQLPTARGRQTQAAIDAAARAVISRKGILATTIADIAAEANRSTASFYNYYDSKEAMVHEWALRFRDEARDRAQAAREPGLTNWERSYQPFRRTGRPTGTGWPRSSACRSWRWSATILRSTGPKSANCPYH